MHEDDPFAPAAKKPVPLQVQLENASILELEDRIARLKDEIGLCEQAIERKKAQRNAADAVFGRKA